NTTGNLPMLCRKPDWAVITKTVATLRCKAAVPFGSDTESFAFPNFKDKTDLWCEADSGGQSFADRTNVFSSSVQ
ncbi:hypothetical protein LOC72_19295, partial [Roseiconus lacunae]|nr:hypothetical protein [Roseiconus lacunae]